MDKKISIVVIRASYGYCLRLGDLKYIAGSLEVNAIYLLKDAPH